MGQYVTDILMGQYGTDILMGKFLMQYAEGTKSDGHNLGTLRNLFTL